MLFDSGVLFSIHPKHCLKILKKEKTIEVRKTLVTQLEVPFTCYIYCTKGKPDDILTVYKSGTYPREANGTVFAQFTCDKIIEDTPKDEEPIPYQKLAYGAAITAEELNKYGKGDKLYGYHISDLKVYDSFKQLNDFYAKCVHGKIPYCPCCKHSVQTYSEGDTEFYEETCTNWIKRPPQSWQYVYTRRQNNGKYE